MRVVFDSNVLVSALVFKSGNMAWFRAHWRNPGITALGSRATINELIRVLSYRKFQLERSEIDALLADYLPYIAVIDVVENPDSPRCNDPDDQMFVDLALQGAADALVTGDTALLAMAAELPVLTPAQYRDKFPARHR